MKLWGENGDQDFWTARRAGAVAPQEERAMALLAKSIDERRFSLYCRMGALPVMGNMTKRIYMIRRKSTVLELEDGQPWVSWCMNGGRRHELPETDHVVVMRALLEGEEYVFRTTANASPAFGGRMDHASGFTNAYESSFLGDDSRHARLYRQNDDFADVFESRLGDLRTMRRMKEERDAARSRARMSQKARLEVARYGHEKREESAFLGDSQKAGGVGGIAYGTGGGFFAGTNATTINITTQATLGQGIVMQNPVMMANPGNCGVVQYGEPYVGRRNVGRTF